MAQAAPTQLAAQIRSQPDALEHMLIAGTVKAQVHAAAEALHRVRRIWVVGTGTSQHAAFLGAAMLQDAGRSAHAVSSMQFVKNAPIVDQADGVVVITHTGETSYALSARALAVLAGMQTITITREGLGMNDVIETVPKETSETYTVSYTTTLLALGHARLGDRRRLTHTRRARRWCRRAVRDAIAASGTERDPAPTALGAAHRRRPGRHHRPRGRTEGPRGGARARRGVRRRSSSCTARPCRSAARTTSSRSRTATTTAWCDAVATAADVRGHRRQPRSTSRPACRHSWRRSR